MSDIETRTLAAEYLRLRAYVEKLNAQLVRGIELRIKAQHRAGKRNVGQLEGCIAVLTEALKQAPTTNTILIHR